MISHFVGEIQSFFLVFISFLFKTLNKKGKHCILKIFGIFFIKDSAERVDSMTFFVLHNGFEIIDARSR